MNSSSLSQDNPVDVTLVPQCLLISRPWYFWPLFIIRWFPVLTPYLSSLSVCLLPTHTILPIRVRGERKFREYLTFSFVPGETEAQVISINAASSVVARACPPIIYDLRGYSYNALWQQLSYFHCSVSPLLPERAPDTPKWFSWW